MLALNSLSPLSSAQEKLLRKQEITRDTPGPILQDIETMLDVVGEEGLRVSSSQNAIYTKALPDLNERLTYSLEADYKRLTQKAYPTIVGLNLLLRATALVRVSREGTHPRLVLNEAVVASWHGLNRTEQYMSLLESWLNRGNEEAIFKNSSRWRMSTLVELLQFIQDIPPTGLELEAEARGEDLRYRPGYARLALMWLFGFVGIEECGTAAGEPWKIDRIDLRPFGKVLLHRLGRALSEKMDAAQEEGPDGFWTWGFTGESVQFTQHQLQHILQPYFPEWERHLAQPHSEFQPATHVFEVQLYDLCRWRIAVPGTASLQVLSEFILDAVGFDRDHLYYVIYQDPFGHEQRVHSPDRYQEPPYVDEVDVGELPLAPGSELTYIYDLGDRWRFELTLDALASDEKDITEPSVLEAEGTPPEQYPDPGEWG